MHITRLLAAALAGALWAGAAGAATSAPAWSAVPSPATPPSNGASLGQADALHFAAGPDGEGGIFGRTAATDVSAPSSAALLLCALSAGVLLRTSRTRRGLWSAVLTRA